MGRVRRAFLKSTGDDPPEASGKSCTGPLLRGGPYPSSRTFPRLLAGSSQKPLPLPGSSHTRPDLNRGRGEQQRREGDHSCRLMWTQNTREPRRPALKGTSPPPLPSRLGVFVVYPIFRRATVGHHPLFSNRRTRSCSTIRHSCRVSGRRDSTSRNTWRAWRRTNRRVTPGVTGGGWLSAGGRLFFTGHVDESGGQILSHTS